MPIYEYKCASCGHTLEVLQKISDALLKDCPLCGVPALSKQVTAAGFQLKGSGWYVTDFRDQSGAGGKKKEEKEGEKAAEKAAEKPAEKPADKAAGKSDSASGAEPAAKPAPPSAPASSAPAPAPAAATPSPAAASSGSTTSKEPRGGGRGPAARS